MDSVENDAMQALFCLGLACLLTFSSACLSHVIVKHCQSLARDARVKEKGWAGFGRVCLLTTLYCLPWAVGWSLWELVLALMDALEPSRQPPLVHDTALAVGVISTFMVLCFCFYLRFGPEPVIPDPELQHLCYSYGFSGSVRRAVISYGVYACVVFIVMCVCDPVYGIFYLVADIVHPYSSANLWDHQAWLVLGVLASVTTAACSLCSALITWTMAVDEASSVKLSRSVHDAFLADACSRYKRRNSELIEEADVSHSDFVPPEAPGDEAAGPSTPRCNYSEVEEAAALPKAVCASVLIYDVLGLVVCTVWGAFTVRSYVVFCGHLASRHVALYALSCFFYAGAVTVAEARVKQGARELGVDGAVTSVPFL